MKNNIVGFFSAYKDKEIYDNTPLEERHTPYGIMQGRNITFKLVSDYLLDNRIYMSTNYVSNILIYLDKEDIEYFYKKYKPKLEEEKEARIKEIEKKYDF